MENYYILHATEDGLSTSKKTKEDVLEAITPDEEGVTDYGHVDDIKFLEELPTDHDWYQYESNALLIIKGTVVVSKPKQMVTKYEL